MFEHVRQRRIEISAVDHHQWQTYYTHRLTHIYLSVNVRVYAAHGQFHPHKLVTARNAQTYELHLSVFDVSYL